MVHIRRRKHTRPTTPRLLALLIAALPVAIQAEEAEKVLAPVTVTATGEQQDGYRATTTRVGKTAQDPHDIPQAITTITSKVIEEQEANSLREALRNVSGLSFNAAEGGRSGDNMMLRGFYTFGDMYLDGIRDTAQYNRELFNLSQVEVLRGAAAMLFGRGQAGGVINQVSKVPSLYGGKEVGIGVGSNGYREVKADVNQRISDTAAFRINLMNRDEGSVRSNPYTGTQPEVHRSGIAPSILFGIGTDHELALNYLWVKTSDRPDYGVPFSSGKPNDMMARANNYYGVDGSFDDSETSISTLSYLHRISPQTQWRTALRAANYKRAYWAVAGQGDLTAASTERQAKTRQFKTDNYVLQSDLNTAFTLLGMNHEWVSGVEYLREESIRWRLLNLGTASNPLFTAGNFSTEPASTYAGDTYSIYAQDSLEFIPDWKLTAGIRRDTLRSDIVTTLGGGPGVTPTTVNLNGDFGENSYRLGLSWQPSESEHYYLGWSDSFSPTADLYQLTGNAYPAERSEVTELGAKWLFFDGDLAFRVALYHAIKNWERSTDLDASAQDSVLTKKRKSDGIELELAGRITENWEIFSGVSLINAKILELSPTASSTAAIGQVPRNTPKYTASFWTTYNMGDGFKIGGGGEYKSSRTAYVPTRGYTPNEVPGYVRWDAMVAYEQDDYTIKFNIQNLFDKLYYDSVYDNGGFTVPGQARRFILTAEYTF